MTKFPGIVEAYLEDLRRIGASGAATRERSRYGPLANLLNEIGGGLKPKVFCVSELADQGAGHPDLGLFAAKQVQRGGQPRGDQLPEHGVVEVKSAQDDAWLTADSAQVSRYWARYRLVLVTNYRDFLLVGEDADGRPARLEHFRLAEDAEDFERQLQQPRAFAGRVGVGLGEYLRRVLSHRARLAEPRDLADLLASHARDALARVEAADAESGAGAAPPGDRYVTPGTVARKTPHPAPGTAPASPLGEARGRAPEDEAVTQRSPLEAVRAALEDALGVQFRGDRGARFFRSTLVQTLFYGVFSAWVLWARQASQPSGAFDWRTAVWHLRAPVLRALFQQLSDPGRLQPLGLVEVLDWTAAALNRVDRAAFFARFGEGQAVPYFYEPFLQAFDPALRKQLGVWYTPPEVVRYMVARVDRALRDDLGIADGLAAQNVYVLDPCCGTGAYLAETLRRIAANLHGQGLGALTGARVRQAATERVFGFEIMPAPFVVAHLQVGLTLQALDAPLAEDGADRAGVFLTNALTGWEPAAQKPLPFPELEEERDRADRVKRDAPILVILGNPPYNGFAGMAVDEERELSTAYRTTRRVRRPEGQGLNDLYVRFFRMAERRIAEKTGQGVVCFISNYSWLDSLSGPGMRERYLDAFDVIRIDNLNGDKYRTGKVAPDGTPDPSVFSTADDPVGIQVGTAIATLVRKANHAPAANVQFRNLWGRAKLDLLTETAEAEPAALYDAIEPVLPLGLPFAPVAVSPAWFEWPALPELFAVSFPGVKSGRDPFVVDIDLDRLKERIDDYFDATLSHDEIARRYPTAMRSPREYDARSVRDTLLMQGGPVDSGLIRYAFRPFDNRWLYWEPRAKLVDRPRPEYQPHVFKANLWIVSQQKPRREWSPPQVISDIGCLDLMDRGATCIPAWLREDSLDADAPDADRRPNLSPAARRYLERLGLTVEDLFHHVLTVLHDPVYRQANAGALRMEWPRIPLPHWSDLSAPAGQGAVPGRVAARSAHSPGDEGAGGRERATTRVAPTVGDAVRESRSSAQADLAAGQGAVPGRGAAGSADSPGHEGAGGRERATTRVAPTVGDAVRESRSSAQADQAADSLAASAARGRALAALLDPDTPVPGVTSGQLRPEIAAIAVPATTHGRHMSGDDFALTSGWGHFGAGQAVMPGQGRAVERAYTGAERTHTRPERTHTGAERTHTGAERTVLSAAASVIPAAASVIPAPAGIQPHPPAYEADAGFQVTPGLTESSAAGRQVEDAPFDALGATTYDIHLNDHAYWRNVPANVWTYRLGGYQVLKKWLSYRERKVLGRDLHPEEVQHFSQTARRIGAILLATSERLA